MVPGVGDEHQVLVTGDVVGPAEAGRSGGAATVLLPGARVGLAQDDVGGLVGIRNTVAPAEKPTVAGVGDPERRSDEGDPERPVERRCRALAAAVLLYRGCVGLAQHQIGCHVVGLRHGVPHQDPVMPRVGHHQSAVVDQHPGRQVHAPLGSAPARPVALGLAIRLAQDHIGGLLVAAWQFVPDQHPVVTGVGDHQLTLAEEHPARGVQPRHRGFRGRQRQAARSGRAQPQRRRPAAGAVDGGRDVRARAEPAYVVPDGVSAHAVTRIQTSPSSTRSGSCSSWAPGALRHSPDVAS